MTKETDQIKNQVGAVLENIALAAQVADECRKEFTDKEVESILDGFNKAVLGKRLVDVYWSVVNMAASLALDSPDPEVTLMAFRLMTKQCMEGIKGQIKDQEEEASKATKQ